MPERARARIDNETESIILVVDSQAYVWYIRWNQVPLNLNPRDPYSIPHARAERVTRVTTQTLCKQHHPHHLPLPFCGREDRRIPPNCVGGLDDYVPLGVYVQCARHGHASKCVQACCCCCCCMPPPTTLDSENNLSQDACWMRTYRTIHRTTTSPAPPAHRPNSITNIAPTHHRYGVAEAKKRKCECAMRTIAVRIYLLCVYLSVSISTLYVRI